MKQLTKYSWAMMLILFISLFNACKKDTTEPDVIASFTSAVSATDYKTIVFTNTAQNFQTLSWNFGDNSALSAELNPTHTFPTTGDFTVTLTATSPGGKTDVFSAKVTITDPNAFLTMLVGDVSKTWRLIRDISTGRYPLEVGPTDHSQIWWAMGLNNPELSNRPCLLNDEWIFTRDGLKMTYDAKGDYWAEAGIYADPGNVCASTTAPMTGKNGEDLSAWKGGNYTFVLTPGATPTLTVNGLGAFVGFCKLANGIEVSSTNPIVVPSTLTYNVVKLTDGDVDTLVIEGNYSGGPGYWRFVLVHYDDPTQEPPIPGPKPAASYTFVQNGQDVTFTNTSTFADTYVWDFGDGSATSTETSPTHTFPTNGIFAVRLTATNANGVGTTATDFYYTTYALTDLTEAMLVGNAWKVRVEDKSIFVGDGLGHTNWWNVPKEFMSPGGTGGDDWSCIVDDEYKFSTGGVYSYDTKGSARNDGYFGGSNGCIDDAGIAASGNGAAFGTATHSFEFTPASAGTYPLVKLINGAGKAAFIGFYKGYNGVDSGIAGGENTNGANPPNGGSATNTYAITFYANSGTKEWILFSVDYTAAHDGTMGWSSILMR